MKKLILISSLLAAGTMVSNAANTITIDDLAKNKTSGDISYNASTGYVTGTGLFDGVYDSTTSKATTYFAATTTFNLDLTAIGVTSTTTSLTNWTTVQLLDYQTSAGTSDYEIGIQITATGLQFTWNGTTGSWKDGSSTVTSGILAWSTLWGNSYSYGDHQYVTLSFESSRCYGNGSADISNGTFLYQLDSGLTKVKTTTFGYSKLASSTEYTAIYLNKNYIENASISSGVATMSEITTTASSLKVIPEPSFFGLFAGTLALGLAGTRRRRSKK